MASSTPRRFALVGVIAILGGVLLAGLLRGEPAPDPAAAEIQALIGQLGDDEFANREAAGRELLKLGDEALPALRKAAQQSRDPEILFRAAKLIAAIGLQSRKSKSIGLEFVLLEPGEFVMGSPAGETGRAAKETQHRVKLTRPFLLGVVEVTQDEYFRVMQLRPSGGDEKSKDFPVVNVSWFDAVEFCNRLSTLDGLAPFYELSDTKRNGASIVSAELRILGGDGYRLPSEAEWEYACRATTETPFHFGETNSGKEANVKPIVVAAGYGMAAKWTELGRTAEVGSYPPNAWGLQDMHGNAAEWCGDWYDAEYYEAKATTDPHGPATGKHRVLRGGSWLVHEGGCRSAARDWATPDERKNYIGFRVARSL